MKSTQYSEKVLDHFRNPRNVGILRGEDVAVGVVGNPVCGDLMDIYIKVEDNIIKDVKLQTFGCGSAIATASMVTEMAKGLTLEEALKITRRDVADELDGLPPIKMHCSNLAADALHEAIKNYLDGNKPKQGVKIEISEKKLEITNEEEYAGKGVYHSADCLSALKNKRVLIVDRGKKSVEAALALTELTPRVVFLTNQADLSIYGDMKKKVMSSDIKTLFQSRLLEVSGVKTVEKARVRDLDEDDEYDLFVDAVIIL